MERVGAGLQINRRKAIVAMTLLFTGYPRLLAAHAAAPTYRVHFYDNLQRSLENVHLVGVYVVPKGEEDVARSNWKEEMHGILADVTNFYRRSFRWRNNLRYTIAALVPGSKKFDQYTSEWDIYNEVVNRVFVPWGDLYRPEVISRLPNEVQFPLINVVGDRTRINSINLGFNKAFGSVWAFINDNPTPSEKVNYANVLVQRKISFAHELGHLFGIVHPWEDPTLSRSPETEYGGVEGNLMGYKNIHYGQTPPPLDRLYLIREQLEKMGVRVQQSVFLSLA